MSDPFRVLILEDIPSETDLMIQALREARLDPQWERVETEEDYLTALEMPYDVILADYSLPGFDALRALQHLNERRLDVPFIIVSDVMDDHRAMECIRQGAADYLLKDRMARLGTAVVQALARQRLQQASRYAAQQLQTQERRFRALIEHSLEGIVLLTADGTIQYASPSSTRILGRRLAEIVGQPALDRIHPEDQPAVRELFARLVEEPDGHATSPFRYPHKTGDWRWIEAVAHNLLNEPSVKAIVVNYRDITDRMEDRQKLQQMNDTLTARIEELKRHNQEIKLITEMGEMLKTCLSVEEAYAVIAQFGPQLFPGDAGALYMFNNEYRIIETVAVWGDRDMTVPDFEAARCWALRRGQVHMVTPGPTRLPCQHLPAPHPDLALCVPMMARGDTVGVFHLCRSHEEAGVADEDAAVTSWKRLAIAVAEHTGLTLANLRLLESFSRQAVRDPLTGLFNRRYMEESLEREARRAARSRQPLSIIMLDLDYLKTFNDTHGHEAGNALLSSLGNYLQSQIRGEDIACRYGGDEFILILPGASLDVARQRGEILINGVNDLSVHLRGQALGTVTVSLGISAYPDDGATIEEVLRAADKAMYHAKTLGRNQFAVWQEIHGAATNV